MQYIEKKLNKRHLNKIRWSTRMAFVSFGILIFAILINEFRGTLFGVRKGYAPLNFAFNFIFYLPSIAISLGLAFMVVGRIIKHWKIWANLNKKGIMIMLSLSLPVLFFVVFFITRIFYN